jgi:hypothetical protein
MIDPRSAALSQRFKNLEAPRQPGKRRRPAEPDEDKPEAGPVVRNTYTLPTALNELLVKESDRLSYELGRIVQSNVVAAAIHLALRKHPDELEALLKSLPQHPHGKGRLMDDLGDQ